MDITETIGRMAAAATDFLASLTGDQRQLAELPFDGDERRNWYYTPVDRQGLMLKQMDGKQQELARRLLATGLSGSGMHRASTIIGLEPILAEFEGEQSRWRRDPERYYLSVFGTPGDEGLWGWRFEGHHVSVNYTIVEGQLVGPTPVFFGANPAQVLHGHHSGLRALKEEEDLARDLLASLDGDQKRLAVVSADAPGDILTRNVPGVQNELADEPAGLSASDMTSAQRVALDELIAVYVGRLPDVIAAGEWVNVENVSASEVSFAWAGSEDRGKGHYYRVLGSSFLAEYDCTQNDANHIHAVWRNLVNDFGEDVLRSHYRKAH